MKELNHIRALLEAREADALSALATLSKNGHRRKPEPQDETGYRQAFSQDVDRILHSLPTHGTLIKPRCFP